MTVYDVSLSDSFVNRLHGSRTNENGASAARLQDPASLTLRFSVPPDALEGHKSELDLRRTARGEFVLQQASDAHKSDGPQSSDQPQGPSGPTFKGPATLASDVECVLVFNPQIQQYELHPVGLDLQMVPALKPRAKPSSSASAKSVLREAPASSKPAISRQPSKRQAPGSGTGSGTASPIASPNLSASPGPQSQAHHSTAMLPPRRATTARLPTRRAVKKSIKPAGMPSTPVASRPGSAEPEPSKENRPKQASSSSATQSSQPQVLKSPQSVQSEQEARRTSPENYSSRSPVDTSRANSNPLSEPTSRLTLADGTSASAPYLASNAAKQQPGTAESRPEQSRTSSSDGQQNDDDSRFDDDFDDFDDLADELADELGKEDENPTPSATSASVGIGTALNSVDDGEDTSEEE